MENMDEGGSFTISTFYDNRQMGEAASEAELIIEIKDTGKGISAEDLPKIFDPFFSTKQNGTGLGLTVVHRIMADHSGTIKIKETGAGSGTCFSLHLPAYSEWPKEKSLRT